MAKMHFLKNIFVYRLFLKDRFVEEKKLNNSEFEKSQIKVKKTKKMFEGGKLKFFSRTSSYLSICVSKMLSHKTLIFWYYKIRKMTIIINRNQFHQHLHTTFTCKDPKSTKRLGLTVFFFAFGICIHKSCS